MKLLGKLLGFLLLIGSIGVGWAWMQYQEFVATPIKVEADGVVYQVRKGASLAAVARDLEAQGVIDDARYLNWYGRYTGQANKIRAGEYLLTEDLVPDSLLALMVSGKSIDYSLTLLEGWNIRQVRAAVMAHEALTQTLEGVDDATLMDRLGRPGVHPEGRFFPDTYKFNRGTTDLDFLRRAMEKMDQELEAAWAARAENIPFSTPEEALILASIVEKETGQAFERPEIAGVFARRLQKGMKLQTDPTVIYGMGEQRLFQALLVDLEAGDAGVREYPRHIRENSAALHQVVSDDRQHDVELEIAGLTGDRDRRIVADDLGGHHGDGFGDHRVDLTGHDAAAWLQRGSAISASRPAARCSSSADRWRSSSGSPRPP